MLRPFSRKFRKDYSPKSYVMERRTVDKKACL